MTPAGTDKHAFWRRLLTIVDTIDDPGFTTEDLEAHLLALDEGFSDAFDPADHYGEYVTVLFCRALRRSLDR